MSSRHLVGSSCWISLVFILGIVPARADAPSLMYTVDGSDVFRVAGKGVRSELSYAGTERLTFQPSGSATRFNATVTYAEKDGSATSKHQASCALSLAPSGAVFDERDDDPEYLTILNQPFSIQLDAPTMHDLHAVRAPVPFDFPSPMTGALLHGSLRRLADASFGGTRVLGIAFTARGPLHGTLPDRPDLELSGSIAMSGTAYYAYSSALLLALDATLVIDGTLGGAADEAVTIVYQRRIRPQSQAGRGS